MNTTETAIVIEWIGDPAAVCLQSLWTSQVQKTDIFLLLRGGADLPAGFLAHYPGVLPVQGQDTDWNPQALAKHFPNVSRLLCLRGDTLIRRPIHDLLHYDLGKAAFGAVFHLPEIRKNGDIAQEWDDHVMLLDPQKLRKLQNPGTPCFLPVRFALSAAELYQNHKLWTLKTFNDFYHTQYANEKKLALDAVILSYSGKEKPWENENLPFAPIWYINYEKSPLPEHPFSKADRTPKASCLVSVVMPTYNVEAYIEETLNSIFAQTCQDFELICADDGSTDQTVSILRRYAEKHSNMTILTGINVNAGYERNRATEKAKGKYVYYMDSDDLISPETLAAAVSYAEALSLDVVYFEGDSFSDDEQLRKAFSKMTDSHTRKHVYPCLYKGWQFYLESRKHMEFVLQPCMKLTRRSLLTENHLRFLEVCQMNDSYHSYCTVLCAKRVAMLPDVFFHRRIHSNSLVTNVQYKNLSRMAESRSANWVGLCLLARQWKHNPPVYAELIQTAERYFNDLLELMRNTSEAPDFSSIEKNWNPADVMNAAAEYQLNFLYLEDGHILPGKNVHFRLDLIEQLNKTLTMRIMKKVWKLKNHMQGIFQKRS